MITMETIVRLNSMRNRFSTANYPIGIAYKIHKLYQLVDNEFTWYQEQLKNLVSTYVETDATGAPKTENGSFILKEGQSREALDGAITALLSIECMKDYSIPKFSIEDFGDIKLTMAEMEALAPFID